MIAVIRSPLAPPIRTSGGSSRAQRHVVAPTTGESSLASSGPQRFGGPGHEQDPRSQAACRRPCAAGIATPTAAAASTLPTAGRSLPGGRTAAPATRPATRPQAWSSHRQALDGPATVLRAVDPEMRTRRARRPHARTAPGAYLQARRFLSATRGRGLKHKDHPPKVSRVPDGPGSPKRTTARALVVEEPGGDDLEHRPH
jgi:hypothetical protein